MVPKRLLRFAREDRERREVAVAEAEGLLSKLSIEPFIGDPEGAVEEFREALELRLADNLREAFLAGKGAAFEMIAAIPPVTKPRRPGTKLSSPEREMLLSALEAPRLEQVGQDAAFVTGLKSAVRAQREAGRSDELILRTLSLDWERKGRRTGQWQRAVLAYARALIGASDQAGQQAGYMGHAGRAAKAAHNQGRQPTR